jgi:hypothetical protein
MWRGGFSSGVTTPANRRKDQMGQFNAIQEQFRFSVEQVIREHLAQDVDRDNAIIEASREITRAAMRPIVESSRRQILITTLWNAIDDSPAPEAGFAALCELFPDAFDDPRDPNSILFAYAATDGGAA